MLRPSQLTTLPIGLCVGVIVGILKEVLGTITNHTGIVTPLTPLRLSLGHVWAYIGVGSSIRIAAIATVKNLLYAITAMIIIDKLKKERDELKARVEELENAMLDYLDAAKMCRRMFIQEIGMGSRYDWRQAKGIE